MKEKYNFIKVIRKGSLGMEISPNKSNEEIYVPSLDDLVKFTTSFETFKPTVYTLKTSDGTKNQELAGYGSTNPDIIKMAKEGKLTEEIAREEVRRRLSKELEQWSKLVPNFTKLPIGVQLALADTSYNGKGVVGTIKGSPSLMKMINTGVVDPNQLVKEMNHSSKAGGWLGVRSAARRAMALGEYNWLNSSVDKYGRQIDKNKYRGPEDWKSSPYYGVYKQGGILKRI